MQYGFIKIGAVTPDIRVSDCTYNALQINKKLDVAAQLGIKVVVFPELCLTGCTCGSLFGQDVLLNAAEEGLLRVLSHSVSHDMLIVVGLPIKIENKIYNCAAAVHKGKLLGVVPQANSCNKYGFFFSGFPSREKPKLVNIKGHLVPFGLGLLFKCNSVPDLIMGIEISNDTLSYDAPSVRLCAAGAFVILNPGSYPEVTGGAGDIKKLILSNSKRLFAAYVTAAAGSGESTTDYVFSGYGLIAENGKLLCENKPFFSNDVLLAEIDCTSLNYIRRKNLGNNYAPLNTDNISIIEFSLLHQDTKLTRSISKLPFLDDYSVSRDEENEHIISIQAHALKKRMVHTGAKKIVIGVSGGIDSTLALVAAARATELMKKTPKDIVAITMPCFGTTSRTKENAIRLCKALDIDCRTIDITETVKSHFNDINQDESNKDSAYENAQARIRTLVLMDIANQCGGIVVGTGDLSELALGWCTYNGDHMSMYSLNASLPKTLIRSILKTVENTCGIKELESVMKDILDTPVSPELLPSLDDEITQETEELIGPYDLHDFFLYNLLHNGYTPEKLYHVAKYAFCDVYDEKTIKKWLKVFIRRFFSQQFKRSCMPDGPMISKVSLSPRIGLNIPSDVSDAIFSEWE